MKKLKSFFKKHKKETIIMLVILLVAIFFRAYKLDEFYVFEHDQDLYSWILKDILVNHHLRLIGQLTSIEGVFIGPLFYYLLAPFYFFSGMNPISATYFAILVGLATIISIFYVFNRFFGNKVGFFGSAIYATSLGPVFFDRWVVPTELTVIWSVWFLYAAFSLAEGKTKSLIIAVALLGLTWHIHVALLPLIPVLAVAFFFAKQKLTFRIVLSSLAVLLFLTLPFWIFELKNNFLQTKSIFLNHGQAGEVLRDMRRQVAILYSTQKVLTLALFDGWSMPLFVAPILSLLFYLFLSIKKIFTLKQSVIIAIWFGTVIVVQLVTKNPISEYYYTNLEILAILFLAMIFGYIYSLGFKKIALGLILIYSAINFYYLINHTEAVHLYQYKKKVIDYIHHDYLKNNYQCMAVSFVAKYGTGVGFRYLTWWEGMHQVNANPKTPLYSIVIPYDSIDKNQLSAQIGYFGVILPAKGDYDSSNCNDPALEPIAPLGFTN